MRVCVSQWVDVLGDNHEFLRGPRAWLPFPPYPGLSVGGLQVFHVYVNQGVESDAIEVQYAAVTEAHARILQHRGWNREVIEQ